MEYLCSQRIKIQALGSHLPLHLRLQDMLQQAPSTYLPGPFDPLHSMIFALLSLAWLCEAAAGTQGLLLEVGCSSYLVRPQEGSEGQLGVVEHS